MSEKSSAVQVGLVTIATPVVYLVGGKLDQARPAIVHSAGDEGIVDLHQFGDYSGSNFYRRCVRHFDDPVHTVHPDILAQQGAYMTTREYDQRRRAAIAKQQEAERERHLNQMRFQNQRIVRLAQDGYTVTQIAAQVGVSDGMVEAVLREEKITPSTSPKV